MDEYDIESMFFISYSWHVDAKFDDPDPSEFIPSQDFVFVICCVDGNELIPEYLQQVMHVFKVDDPPKAADPNSSENPEEDALAQVM